MATVTARSLDKVARRFAAFRAAAGFGAIRDESDYAHAMTMIDAILDATRNQPAREDADHPMASLLDYLTMIVRDYEAEHHAIAAAEPRQALRLLMEQHGLTQSDLPQVGNQSVVSQILAGRRMLNTRQIAALVARFGVGADAFIEPHPAAH